MTTEDLSENSRLSAPHTNWTSLENWCGTTNHFCIRIFCAAFIDDDDDNDDHDDHDDNDNLKMFFFLQLRLKIASPFFFFSEIFKSAFASAPGSAHISFIL